ncbi:hypothetical protein AB4Z21_22495, partial [Paenibacillus sp. MCAF20]
MMGAFNGLVLTNRGLALQGKVQAGAPLVYTKIAMGDGNLGGTTIPNLTAMISLKKNLPITRLTPQTGGKALVGTNYSNSEITTGFYFRELGVFANDPDLGEILYCYGNAGAGADYIAPGGGADLVESHIVVQVLTGNASNVSAIIDESLVFVTLQEFDTAIGDLSEALSNHIGSGGTAHAVATTSAAGFMTSAQVTKLNGVATGAGSAGSATDAVIGNRTVNDTTAASFTGTITALLSGLFNLIKGITGKASALTAPATNLESVKTHMDSTADIHGAVSTATASRIMARDANGRTKVAAPSASDDVAIKQTVDDHAALT